MIPKSSVLFVIDHLDTGGAPAVIRRLCWAFSRLSVPVVLIVLSGRVSGELPEDTSVYSLALRHRNRWQRLRRYERHARLLDELLEDQGIQYFLAVSHLHYAHQVTARSSLSLEAWYCLHSDPARELLGNKGTLAKLKKARSVRRLYSGKKVMGVSNGIIDSLERFFLVKPEATVGMHNPIEISTIRDLAKAEIDDGLPSDYVLFVGRLEQRSKRFDRLLNAYRYSGLQMPIVIVGEGGDRAFIEKEVDRLEIGDRVLLLGHRDNPYPYMKRAKALVLSSDYEGFSLVLAEALACGTPVVSTDCPSGPCEILKGALSNYLVPLDDGRQLGNALRRVVEHPPHIPRDIVEDFDSERVAKRYLSLADRQVPKGLHSQEDLNR